MPAPTAAELDDETLAKYAEQGLQRPDDYGIHHDIGQYTTHAAVMGYVINEDDPRGVSNFYATVKALREVDPDEHDFRVMYERHWACGGLETLYVRVRDDNGQFTAAWREVVAIGIYLTDEYPVLDESDLSERETAIFEKELDDALDSLGRDKTDEDDEADFIKKLAATFYRYTDDPYDVDHKVLADCYREARDDYFTAAGLAFLTESAQAERAALTERHDPLF